MLSARYIYLCVTVALVAACAALPALSVRKAGMQPGGQAIVEYDAQRLPGLLCAAGRVIAESDPRLTPAQRRALWRQYGLAPSFEWLVPETGFTYHELSIRRYTWIERLRAHVTGRALPPRELPQLIAALNEDQRLHWAAPDALILEWDSGPNPPPSKTAALDVAEAVPAGTPVQETAYGVTLVDENERSFTGGLEEWARHPEWPEPLPDFEYYLLCDPDGTAVPWAPELAANAAFMQRCRTLYGTGQARALAEYRAAGAPALAQVTVCVADTGVFTSHPDLAGRLHPNAIDANYSGYSIAAPGNRPAPDAELTDRNARTAIGLPRPAIKGQPASHGTCTAGIIARCTAGFGGSTAQVRLLPASLKSERTFAISGTRIKSPISSFIKLVACLYQDYPTGSFTPAADAAVQNMGDVRVVSTSASVPRSYFSDAQWRLVSSLANKGADAILEDLRVNDRVYVFAAGNEAQGEPNKPGDLAEVLAASATLASDSTKPWSYAASGEGANVGQKCVSAPGHGIITSTLYASPNLRYLPEQEVPAPRENYAVPRRTEPWVQQTNRFCATSSATPQVAALAALLYAQQPQRMYGDVVGRIEDSTGGRVVAAEWGTARGLIDYAWALDWPASARP